MAMGGVFIGDQARDWIAEMGEHGDLPRQAVVNPIIADVLEHFAGNATVGRPPIVPCTLVQDTLKNVRSRLVGFGTEEQLSNHLIQWHRDDANLAKQYSHLPDCCLWDFGCGDAYLGQWLAARGVKYVGIEPGPELRDHAARIGRELPYQ